MGTDIHVYYEVLQDGKWTLYDWEKEFVVSVDEEYGYRNYNYRLMMDHPLYVDRNYNLFAILANVRNGHGFAGCITGSGFNVIGRNRGLPHDASHEVKKAREEFGLDGHSTQWYSLRELMEYDYSQVTTQYGYVDIEQYEQFKKNGKPDQWCGEVDGNSVVKVVNSTMDSILDGKFHVDPSLHYYTQVKWTETYQESVGEHWFDTLKWLDGKFGRNSVRLVFWFDN